MSYGGKVEKAKRLVELIGVGKGLPDLRRPSQSQVGKNLRFENEEQFINLQIELRAKHMTDQELDASLDFYTSDIRTSFLKAQESIRNAFSETFIKRMNNSDSKAVGWVSSNEIKRQQSTVKQENVPVCSLCRESPDHIGKIVAGRDDIFLCRNCISNACGVLKDTGFPID